MYYNKNSLRPISAVLTKNNSDTTICARVASSSSASQDMSELCRGAGERQGESAVDLRRLKPPRLDVTSASEPH